MNLDGPSQRIIAEPLKAQPAPKPAQPAEPSKSEPAPTR